MHRIASIPGGWNPNVDGVILINQDPAPLVIITAADTEIQTIAAATENIPENFPELRVVNLLQLQQQLTIDTYAAEVLSQAQVVILRLLGGVSYWAYGVEVLEETARKYGVKLLIMPGDDRPDPNLISHSNVDLALVNQVWRYFIEGGITNCRHCLEFVAATLLDYDYQPPPPQIVPRVGLYEISALQKGNLISSTPLEKESLIPPVPLPLREGKAYKKGGLERDGKSRRRVGILFYRAHYLAGNTGVIEALGQCLQGRDLEVVPVFVSSLRDRSIQAELINYFSGVDLIINTTSFAISRKENDADNPLINLGVPILQVILSSGTLEDWESSFQGLAPRDMAMNVALPEMDGKIITRAISFKAVQTRNERLQTDVVTYKGVVDRLDFVADLTQNWLELKQTPPQERRIAVILANYPNKDGRIANGVGLDTPASCVEILRALQEAGYDLPTIPATGNELIELLTTGVTNDSEARELRAVNQSLALEDYQTYFTNLSPSTQQEISQRWGEPQTNHPNSNQENSLFSKGAGGIKFQSPESTLNSFPESRSPHSTIPIAGQKLGNIFLGIQPSRGYDLEPSLNYHAPDLVPTHDYLAFYYWLREVFQAQAIIHVGKHGNLEWLPGKSIALSEQCYPEIALGAIPNFYPFIVNDPGEGSQAKRRTQAVIIDHLTPPLTRAELYGNLLALEGLIDEYYTAESLDPSRLNLISDRITALIKENNLDQDLDIPEEVLKKSQKTLRQSQYFNDILSRTDNYLCELKEAQIRDGLHIFGQCPEGRLLRDLVVAIARHPSPAHQGITRALALDLGLDFDPLTAVATDKFQGKEVEEVKEVKKVKKVKKVKEFSLGNSSSSISELPEFLELAACRHQGDVVEFLEIQAGKLIDNLISSEMEGSPNPLQKGARLHNGFVGSHTAKELEWIKTYLLPNLYKTSQEITHLLQGLDGKHIPNGVAGAPTRGKPEVLPTGRNFYSVDIRALPTETAWSIGRKAAALVIERYTQEQGEYPQTLALSVWGTATMRTGGDDIAQALALLGVQPVWDGVSRRVVDFEILPLSVLGRPRVDVTLRISGFFRDAFPNLIDLFDQAVVAVSQLEEPEEMNPLAAKVAQEIEFWQEQGLELEEARRRSQYRVFGSKPGAYGAGLQGLIEAQNWSGDEDLARAFLNWSSYAYTGQVQGENAPESFQQRLRETQIVLHNQDNREHDLLDSDDYYQFQGGLTAAVRSLTGKNPQTYFGDNSLIENPKIRSLREEITRVYRSRVVNPKWIAGVMRHGYKGAFEMAATVDYLFAYDATAHCVADHMYQGVAEAYIFDPQVQEFVQANNPWALRDMAERLLEAKQRGLWQEVSPETVEKLRAIVHQSEGAIEAR
jgi:cobaltochelatase CobN